MNFEILQVITAPRHLLAVYRVSKLCVQTAANIAHNKSIDELQKINMVTIMDGVGQLPETHMHCAQLAEITLRRSVKDFLRRHP